MAEKALTFGRLNEPYPVEHCANTDCERPLTAEDCEGTSWAVPDGAYLYRDLSNGKLCVFCDDCARYVELSHPERFKVVPL